MPPKAEQIDQYRWRVKRAGDMKQDAIVFASAELFRGMEADACLDQLVNVASLPGLAGPALAMPDAHQGYGFPIGGVAAFDPHSGVVSPGGVGYDINCGVRLLASKLAAADLGPAELNRLADCLFAEVPSGVGQGGAIKLSRADLCRVMEQGAAWAVKAGLGGQGDLEYCEANGALPFADPEAVSQRAFKRGAGQVGTLGAGNHFIELARVEEIHDQEAAAAFGLWQGQAVFWLHSGSRGLGHQVCDDALKNLAKSKDAIHPPDRQLVAAPPHSRAGEEYLGAMAAAANYAFANRQALSALVRGAVEKALAAGPAALGLRLVYDVAHNIAKLEEHAGRLVWVHRKGATRALGPGHRELPAAYKKAGQPVLLPGDMGRGSYVLKGSARAEKESFASAAHGAGRALSRTKAKAQARGRDLLAELAAAGVTVRAGGLGGLAEEMPQAYKDAAAVVETLANSGLAPLVARTRPLVVIKG